LRKSSGNALSKKAKSAACQGSPARTRIGRSGREFIDPPALLRMKPLRQIAGV
jgi:hypothetical protein